MAKNLKIDPKFFETAKLDFLKALSEGKFNNGEINFNRKFVNNIDKRTTVIIEKIAWDKMMALVEEYSSEIAWHGIAKRLPKDAGYIIEDILIYPQEVSGITVTTDQIEYQDWLYNQPDEVFDNLRMQGHSHVNMSTSPSTVDTNYYDGVINQLPEDMFYIFLIVNKRKEMFINIYDKKIGILFETKDIDTKVSYPKDDPVQTLLKEAKEVVKKKEDSFKNYIYNRNIGKYDDYGWYGYNYTSPKKKDENKKSKPLVEISSIPGFSDDEFDKLINDPLGVL